MIKANDIVKLNITKEDIFKAIEKAQNVDFINNLRKRDCRLSFDCKVRGYIGEIGIQKWLYSNDIASFSKEEKKPYQVDIDMRIHSSKQDYEAEIKTSAIPDNWIDEKALFKNCIEKGDIKILANPEADFHSDINRDIFIQVYFGFARKKHDDFIMTVKATEENIRNSNKEELYNLFRFKDYIDNTFFVAWNHKKAIISNLESLNPTQRQFCFGKRAYWTCNIRNAFQPQSLIDFIDNN